MDKTRILVVEDEGIVAEDLREGLQQLGYEVAAVAHSGQEALAYTEAVHPDLVLMDIEIQGEMDGVETAKKVREQFRIPVVYLTAHADAGTLERIKQTEPYGYILKPFRSREVHTMIEVGLYRHRMEMRSRQHEQLLHTILANIDDAVISVDSQGRITYLNPAAASLTGWSEAEATGQEVGSVYCTSGEADLPAPHWSAKEDGVFVTLARHRFLKTRRGVRLPISEHIIRMKDANGQVTGNVYCFRDLTARKLLKEWLRESKQRFTQRKEGLNDALLVYTLEGKLIDANQVACQMLGGYSLEGLMALSLDKVEIGFNAEELQRQAQEMQPGQPVKVQRVYRRKDGMTFPVQGCMGLWRVGTEALMVEIVRGRIRLTSPQMIESAFAEQSLSFEQLYEQLGKIVSKVTSMRKPSENQEPVWSTFWQAI